MIHEQISFFQNKIEIENVVGPRFEVIESMCRDRKVLHVGCADSQFYSEKNNLHLYLSKTCKELHGMDIDNELLKEMYKVYPGTYFNNLNEITDKYNLILVPEVLEHVLNVNEFLSQIFKLKSKLYFITAPNCQTYANEMIVTDDHSIEIIHPDHKYWFSPYTLYNCLKPFINDRMVKMYYLEKKSIVAALIG